jgi:two-component system cell cycle sensor histidine kinase/response regulator CckA
MLDSDDSVRRPPTLGPVQESIQLSILLAEDDADDALITRRMLDEIDGLRCQVDWLSTFEAAAELICDSQYDLYLFDYSLGAHTGVDLLRIARERGCTTPVIMLTGHSGNEIILEAIHAGAADYLVKGQFAVETLGRSIRYAMDRTRAESALRVSEERYRNLFNNASEMVFSYDWMGRLTAVNRSTERTTGYSRDELTMMRLADLLTKDSLDAMDDMNVRQMAGDGHDSCFIAIKTKQGAIVPVEVSSSLITDGRRPIEFQAIGCSILNGDSPNLRPLVADRVEGGG